jgi:hypothetical protein
MYVNAKQWEAEKSTMFGNRDSSEFYFFFNTRKGWEK